MYIINSYEHNCTSFYCIIFLFRQTSMHSCAFKKIGQVPKSKRYENMWGSKNRFDLIQNMKIRLGSRFEAVRQIPSFSQKCSYTDEP